MQKAIFILILFFNITLLSGQNSTRLDSIIELGDDLLSLNDYNEAEKRYDQALKIRESYPPAIEAKIKVLLLQEKYSKAGKITEDAIDNHPNNASFYMYNGQVLIEKENYEAALENLNKALQLAKSNSDKIVLNKAYVNRGAAYQKLNQFDKALEDYSKAIEINNHNPNVFVYRGYLFYKQNNYDKAITDFNRVLELDPNNHYALYNIGMSQLKKGNQLDACDAFHRACELGNTNACKMVISKCLRGG